MLAPLTIRLAKPEERAALEALMRRASLSNEGDRAALLANPEVIELPAAQIEARQVFVAERGGAPVGFAAVLDREDGDTELDGLFTDPPAFRTGVARALVARCAAYARDHGAHALHVVGNLHAADFYAACGFEKTGETQTQFASAPTLRLRL